MKILYSICKEAYINDFRHNTIGGAMGWLEILTNMYTYDKIINSHAIVGVSQMINK